MAMGNIQIMPEDVRQISTNIRNDSSTLMEIMTRLTGQIQGVAGASWQGQSATQFQRAWEQWQSAFTQLRSSLDTMPPALDGLVHNMVDGDNSLTLS